MEPMMILRSSPPSPFGRKVKIAAALLGLDREMSIVKTDTNDAGDPLRGDNPLGKIPTLVLEDRTVIYDSRVILEYLDMRAGGGVIIPKDGMPRIRALTLHALADGLMEAALLQVYEIRFREESRREPRWMTHQAGKVARALAHLEAAPPVLGPSPSIGTIGVACALGYLDLRFEGSWRAAHPKLVAWLDTFADQVPAFEATRVTA
jgi:glutathione S-transferase